MADIVIPAALRVARSSFRYIGQTGVTRGLYTGAAQTTSFGGDRVGCTLEFTPHGGKTTTGKSERAQLETTLMSMQDKQNRVLVTDDSNDTDQGTFPGAELFTNTTFDGTTGWTPDANSTLSAYDGVLKLTASRGGVAIGFAQMPTFVAYAPYVVRAAIVDGAQSLGLSIGPALYDLGSVASSSNYSTTRGYLVTAIVAESAGASAGAFPIVVNSTSGFTAGMTVSLSFASCSRCFLADGIGNLFTKSDEFDHADWTKNELTITANAANDPYGTALGDKLTPSTNVAGHYAFQSKTVSAAAADFMMCGYFHAGGYNFVSLQIQEQTGSTVSSQVFNLNTGALGAAGATGANWANRRASIVSMGDGWYYCSMVVRKTNAATGIVGFVVVHSTDSTATFAGNGSNGVYGIAATLFQSAVFANPVRSTTAAVAASTQTGGQINVKGLPASTAALLKVGRWLEIDGQLKMVMSELTSDAAGRGVLKFSPPLRRALSDNTPIIVVRPMGRFLLAGDTPGWDNVPGVVSTASLDLEEAFA